MEKYELIETIHTADAELETIIFSDDTLTVTYYDWQGKLVVIRFNETLAYRGGPFYDAIPRNDSSYKVVYSLWLAQCEEELRSSFGQQFTSTTDFLLTYFHYKLAFNSTNFVVDVIAKSFEIEND